MTNSKEVQELISQVAGHAPGLWEGMVAAKMWDAIMWAIVLPLVFCPLGIWLLKKARATECDFDTPLLHMLCVLCLLIGTLSCAGNIHTAVFPEEVMVYKILTK